MNIGAVVEQKTDDFSGGYSGGKGKRCLVAAPRFPVRVGDKPKQTCHFVRLLMAYRKKKVAGMWRGRRHGFLILPLKE